ncbi:unnamed protein product [Callosobruchus maculatus]|uniref:Uncharacterized protein n=1 Tax=Callosobruchus maculatus TaxID=64391 RepID=A0A653BWT2_CALMS|nr:unnamed protein product [Callosobruchus maculatus]
MLHRINVHSNFTTRFSLYMMSSKSRCNKKSKKKENEAPKEDINAISLNKSNNIIVQILAKPGAKQNGITVSATSVAYKVPIF